MNSGKRLSCDEFKRLVTSVVDEFEPLELSVDEESLKTFCRLTGHDFSLYREKNLIQQGYKSDEICRKLRVTPNNFYVILSRGRQLMKMCLEEGSI